MTDQHTTDANETPGPLSGEGAPPETAEAPYSGDAGDEPTSAPTQAQQVVADATADLDGPDERDRGQVLAELRGRLDALRSNLADDHVNGELAVRALADLDRLHALDNE